MLAFVACSKDAQENVSPESDMKANAAVDNEILTRKLLNNKDFLELVNLLATMDKKKETWLATLSSKEKEQLFTEISAYRQTKKLPNVYYASKEELKDYYQKLWVLQTALRKDYKHSSIIKAIRLSQTKTVTSSSRVEGSCSENFWACRDASFAIFELCSDGDDCNIMLDSDNTVCKLKFDHCVTGQW